MTTRGEVYPDDEKVKRSEQSEVSVMSERTVSENNKMWEAAERMAEKVVADQKAASEEEKRKQKKRLVKLILMMVLIALIMIFASIQS